MGVVSINIYIASIITAFLTFPSMAAMFTIPYAIFNYRKHGRLNKWDTFLFFLYVLYFTCAFMLVVYPMPESRVVEVPAGTQLIPFHFIYVLIESSSISLTDPSTYLKFLTSMEFIQVAFNILLTVPLGVFARYRSKYGLVKTILTSLGVSLFFEITQLTAFFGMYSNSWRVFDVDDLFLNTLGGTIGWLITPMLIRFLPEIKMKTDNSGTVSIFRRMVAFACDWGLLYILLQFFIGGNGILPGLIAAGVNTLVLYISKGHSLGLWLTRMEVKGKWEKLRFRECFARCFGLYLTTLFIVQLLGVVSTAFAEPKLQSIPVILQFAYVLLLAVVTIVAGIRRHPLIADRISGTTLELTGREA